MLWEEALMDGNWLRFALLATVPLTFAISIVSTLDSLDLRWALIGRNSSFVIK